MQGETIGYGPTIPVRLIGPLFDNHEDYESGQYVSERRGSTINTIMLILFRETGEGVTTMTTAGNDRRLRS